MLLLCPPPNAIDVVLYSLSSHNNPPLTTLLALVLQWYDGVCEIATKSPILLSTDPLNSELSFNFMIKSEAVQASGMYATSDR